MQATIVQHGRINRMSQSLNSSLYLRVKSVVEPQRLLDDVGCVVQHRLRCFVDEEFIARQDVIARQDQRYLFVLARKPRSPSNGECHFGAFDRLILKRQ